MAPLNIILIGGGKISCGKNRFSGDQPMSHMEGIIMSQNVVAHAVVETSEEQKASIARDWEHVKVYQSLREVPRASCEVVVICSPTINHHECIFDAIERKPLAILVEKPLCFELNQAENIFRLSQSSGVPIYVNFNRRMDKRFNELSKIVSKKPISIDVDYTNGINNYGSHFIDLIIHWYGRCLSVKQIGKFDSNATDPNPSFILQIENGLVVHFNGFSEIDYDLLDMNIWYKSGVVRLRAGGANITVESPELDLYYENYAHLNTVSNSVGLVSGFREFYDQLGSARDYHSLDKACGIELGVLNVRVIDAVFRSFESGGETVFL